MDIDVAQTAAAVMPYVTAAAVAYGASTLEKVQGSAVDKAADATVGLGHRIMHRVLRRPESRPVIEGAIVDLANGEEDSAAALKLQIRKALAADPDLAAELARMLPAGSTHIEASGERSIATGSNSGILSTGDGATIFHR